MFCTAFAGNFSYFSYKEVQNFWKAIFPHLFYSIIFSENTAIHCLLVSNTFEIQSRTRSTLLQSWHSKRLLNTEYNPFIYPSLSNRKTALVLNIDYDLLNLSLRLFQTYSHSFTGTQNLLLQKNNAKYFHWYC